ncbi:hypothetical protein [Spirosoma foliorum]|uniref:Uncharacterized protein n=1 Tax=Spirosoma foliorum TaxID=2710596 RepID=A0A7G5H2M7_9BACT|nr:hypothetical protein [Spirosoma foliorum]QMW05369.1 hypothetical protein H3H32_10990 [Spirosoma foliorum]
MNEILTAMIRKADLKLNGQAGWESNDMQRYANLLIQKGSVEVGWRESCGTTHPTVKQYRAWKSIVSSMRKQGYVVEETRVHHPNAYASNNGGFWNSIIYKLIDRP